MPGKFSPKGRPGLGRVFIKEAARLYRKCHAEQKEIQLLERYPDYFEEEAPWFYSPRGGISGRLYPSSLDVNYLMKSSRLFRRRSSRNPIEKDHGCGFGEFGGQHGHLLIEEDGDLYVRAESHITEIEGFRTLIRS